MNKKKYFYPKIVLGLLAVASVFLILSYLQSKQKKTLVDIEATNMDQTDVFNQGNGDIATKRTEINDEPLLPGKYLLKVLFASQAPFGDWSQPYQDACEEASIIMTAHYLTDQSLSKEQMKEEIDSSVAWQVANWGEHSDLNAEKTSQLARDYFHLSARVVRNYSIDEIKKTISSGLPVLAPSAGRRLGNPNFRGAGPEYHMLVIIGYDDSQGIFITNDPGTRKGESYVYKYQTVLDAISGPKTDLEKALIVLTNSE